MPVSSTMTKAPAPISGGMIWPPDEATASTAPARAGGYPSRRIAGSVIAPVEATLAEAEPEIEPNSAEARTETLAAPALRRPAAAAARFMKPWPASPALRTAPMMTNTATMLTETPVRLPHRPPSATTMVPRKLSRGRPGWPNSPGRWLPNRP